jgi:homospermidine synthase
LVIVSADDEGYEEAKIAGCVFIKGSLTVDNYRVFLADFLSRGDVLLNVSINVSSVALITWCQRYAVHYVDTCIEPWRRNLENGKLPLFERTNYSLRDEVLSLGRQGNWESTALVAHGANPGLSFHFLKRALLDLATICGARSRESHDEPNTQGQWASLAYALDVRVIQIAERDSQVDIHSKESDEFVNTWSVNGFLAESCQPAEVGWGSHESMLPADASVHTQGCRSSICLNQRGAATRIRSWTPAAGEGDAFLISLFDAVAMSDYLSVHRNGRLIYRPTVYYAYRPCDDAQRSLLELEERGWQWQSRSRLLKDGLNGGEDELGVLLLGPRFGGYWYGSRLSLEEARRQAPCNSATSLQVAAGVLSGLSWVQRHPCAGLVEPGDLAHDFILRTAGRYLGAVGGVMTNWASSDNYAGDETYQFGSYLI